MRFIEFVERYGKMGVIHSREIVVFSSMPEVLRVQLSLWKEKGYLIPLKRGVYLLSSQFLRRDVPLFYISNELVFPSYVSLESALSHYELIPEGIFRGVVAVTTRKTVMFSNPVGVFYYHHVKPSLFVGFKRINIDGFRVNIATPEKALLDYFYLKNLKREEMKGIRLQNLEILDASEFISFSSLYPKRVQKLARRIKDEITTFTGS